MQPIPAARARHGMLGAVSGTAACGPTPVDLGAPARYLAGMAALRSRRAGVAWHSMERVPLRAAAQTLGRVLRQRCSEQAPGAVRAAARGRGCQASGPRRRQVAARIAGPATCVVVSLAGCSATHPTLAGCQPLPPPPLPQPTPPPLPAAGRREQPSITCRGIARFIDMILQVCVGALLGRMCNGRYPGLITAVVMALPTVQMAFVWPGQSFGKRYMELQVRRTVHRRASQLR